MHTVAATTDYDIVIVGGGPVATAFALALESSGRNALLLEGNPEQPRRNDPRSLALSYGSRLILERLGVWGDIAAATAIESIHISHRGRFGRALLTAAQAGVPALGYVVPYGAVQHVLGRALERAPHLTTVKQGRATTIDAQSHRVRINFLTQQSQASAQANLLVIADGGALTTQLAEVNVREYGQCAIVANVATTRAHGHIAYERFTPDGPLALLPREHGYAMVWTVPRDAAEPLCQLTEQAFIAKLQSAFGDRVGRFTAANERVAFPLSLRVAKATVTPRTVLLGNAAQALHPVAGQGLNLGLRDAWELAQYLRKIEDDTGGADVIAAFQRRRHTDRAAAVLITDALVRVFSNDHLALRWLRGCGLTFLDSLPPVKRAFMQQMTFGRPW